MPIVWEVSREEKEVLKELLWKYENREIGEEEFAEELAAMPSYPKELRGSIPRPGDDILIREKKRPTMVQVGRPVWTGTN